MKQMQLTVCAQRPQLSCLRCTSEQTTRHATLPSQKAKSAMLARRAALLGGTGLFFAAPGRMNAAADIKIESDVPGFGKAEATDGSLLLVRYTGRVAETVRIMAR